ncbi:MAG: hypothetical protein CMN93_08515 [Synechococcus sp. CPC35]|nr:hypothetical protein [Synechococcus sp. CPC35]
MKIPLLNALAKASIRMNSKITIKTITTLIEILIFKSLMELITPSQDQMSSILRIHFIGLQN